MGYENDPFRDEDGEALMDHDDIQSDREQSPEHRPDVPVDDLEDWDATERSQTPVYDNDKVKPKKRLIKESGSGKEFAAAASELLDEDDGGFQEDDEGMERKKRIKLKEKFKGEKTYTSRGDGGSGSKSGRKGMMDSGRLSAKDREVDEMWTHVGANDEEDREPVRNMKDDDFIDDTGVDPADRYASDHEQRSPHDAPEAKEGEEDDEIKQLFKVE